MLGTYDHLAALFEAGLSSAVAEVKPERAFVAYRGRTADHLEYPTPYATHGFSMAGLYVNEDISTKVIEETLREGKSLLIVDAVSTPGLTNRTSVILSGLRSILTVPLRHPNGLTLGLLYVDNRIKIGAFEDRHRDVLTRAASELVEKLGPVERKMKEAGREPTCHEPFEKIKTEALSLAEQGRYTQALGVVESYLFGRHEGEDPGQAYGVKSRILQQMGQLDSAMQAAAISVFLLGQKASGRNEHYALMLNNLAGLHVEMENLVRAHGLLVASQSYWTRLANYDSRHAGGLCATKYNLGKLHAQMGNPEEAKRWFDQALLASRETYGEDHPRTQKIAETLASL
ncbi:MAG: tetratricopeptide repeat protein [Vulcanimicrobiota bacterium]